MGLFSGIQSVFNPQSDAAAAIAQLGVVLFSVGGIVFAVTMVLAGLALWRRPAWLAHRRTVLIGGVVVPATVVFGLLLYSLHIAAAGGHDRADRPRADLQIDVTAHQWWWQVRYRAADGSVQFETANEIRLPIGRSADIFLRSNDVLHSFWVPNLGGKVDVVPGRVNRIRLTPAQGGVFRGQCAEYCGGPHALMAFYVMAVTDAEFDQWRELQRRPAATSNRQFMARCAVCHTIRGTEAGGTLGPDLTHIGGRLAIGAGILPNNESSLARWIASSQHIKPGNLMPSFPMLDAGELRVLADYLAGLK